MKILSEINIYPIKSCRRIGLSHVQIGPKGPWMDRRWTFADKQGRFLTQRQIHSMACIEVALQPPYLLVTIPGNAPMKLPICEEGPEKMVTVWNDTCMGVDQGDEIAALASAYLKVECRLMYLPERSFRPVNPQYAKHPHEQVSFADAYPSLLISEASLEELNSRLQQPVPMNRFRPNFVVKGCEPFEEDSWKKVRIGEVIFRFAKPCSRCVATTVDQATGVKGLEPLQTLATYRKFEKGIMFGQNLIHENQGAIHLGDSVEILE